MRPHTHDAPRQGGPRAMEASAQGMRRCGSPWPSCGAHRGAAGPRRRLVRVGGAARKRRAQGRRNAGDAPDRGPAGRRSRSAAGRPTRRYTYGYGRAEDLAGLVIVLLDRRLRRPGRRGSDRPAAGPARGDRPRAVAAAAAWSDSPATRSSPATGSPSAAGSARPPWSPTASTPAPTASPAWRCCSARPGSRSAGAGRPDRRPGHHRRDPGSCSRTRPARSTAA